MATNGHIEVQTTKPDIRKCDLPLLEDCWPVVREKLLFLQRKAVLSQKRAGLKADTLTWIPEQIRMAVLKGLASQNTIELYLVFEGNRMVGFFITSNPPDEFANVPLVLHLWMVWSSVDGLIERCEPFVDNLARKRGCLVLQHTSGRTGWMRRNPRGWRLSQMIWRKDLAE